jgi:hypothetical protein
MCCTIFHTRIGTKSLQRTRRAQLERMKKLTTVTMLITLQSGHIFYRPKQYTWTVEVIVNCTTWRTLKHRQAHDVSMSWCQHVHTTFTTRKVTPDWKVITDVVWIAVRSEMSISCSTFINWSNKSSITSIIWQRAMTQVLSLASYGKERWHKCYH